MTYYIDESGKRGLNEMRCQRAVYVVTTKEMLGPQLIDVGVAVLGSRLKAERWINQQIDDLVTEYELDRSSAVTDRFVQIDGWNHTMEYEVAKEEVL